MKDTGRLFVFEGIDGSGKGTVIQTMAQLLSAQGFEVVVVREPGGPIAAEACRDVLKNNILTPLAAFHVMRAASVELHHSVIMPALALGKVVLSDRCTWASAAAYQGSHLGVEFIFDSIFSDPADIPAPDLAIWLDVSIEESARRREARGEDEDNFADLRNSRTIYRRLSALGLLERVDADVGIDLVETACARKLAEVLKTPHPDSRLLLRKPTYLEAATGSVLGSYNLK